MDIMLVIPLATLFLSVVGYLILKLFKNRKRIKQDIGPEEVTAMDLVNAWSSTKPVETVYSLPASENPIVKEDIFSDKKRLKRSLFGPAARFIYESLPKDFLRRYQIRVDVGFTRVVEHKGEIKVIEPGFIAEDFIIFSILGAIVITAAGLLAGYLMNVSYLTLMAIALFSPIFGFFLIFLIPYFKFEKRKDKIEEHLPDVLEQLSTMAGMKNMDEIIGYLAETRLGPVSEEFAIADHMLKRNLNLSLAVNRMKERTESKMLARVLKLLEEGAKRGVDVGDAAKKMAESLRNRYEILKERAASLSLQRYTLLAAASLLVPLILGIVWGISTSLANFPQISMAGLSFNAAKAQQTLKSIRTVFAIYIVIHAIEASFAVARQEGDIKRAIIYIVPLSLISYFIYTRTCQLASIFFAT